jgi:hypothetical protein
MVMSEQGTFGVCTKGPYMYYFVIEGPNAIGGVLLFLIQDKARQESGPVRGRAGTGVGRHGGHGREKEV